MRHCLVEIFINLRKFYMKSLFKNTKRLARLFKFIYPYKTLFSIGLIFLLLSSFASLIFPALLGDLVNGVNKDVNEINKIAILLFTLFVAQAIFSYFRILIFVIVTEKTLATIRQQTYNHILKLPMLFFSSKRVGELNSRIASDISLLQETFTTTIAEFIRLIILIIGGTIFLFITEARLTLFMLALLPVMMILAVFFGNFIRKFSKQVQDKIAESNTIVDETFQAINNVKSFVNELFEMKRYKNKTDEVVKIAVKGGKYRAAFASFIILCIFGAIVAVIWRGVIMVNNGDILIGSLFSFVLYSVYIGASIGGIADIYAQIQKSIGATERLLDILEEKPEVENISDKKISVDGNVKFDNVSFSYPNRKEIPVLKNINFEIKKGEKVAIVGPSGSGKTTLIALLFRYYDVQEGEITIDNKKIKKYDVHSLRRELGLVPQEVMLFGGSINENIKYGNINSTKEEIIAASKKANSHDFIMNFTDKYKTVVGERGVQLSGGQRQRVAIARTILKNPNILILDEATSSLDSESEREVQKGLNELVKNKTAIIIAHRMSTIQNVDKIIVLDKGSIVEIGNHQKLIANKGLYSHLYKMQFEV